MVAWLVRCLNGWLVRKICELWWVGRRFAC